MERYQSKGSAVVRDPVIPAYFCRRVVNTDSNARIVADHIFCSRRAVAAVQSQTRKAGAKPVSPIARNRDS